MKKIIFLSALLVSSLPIFSQMIKKVTFGTVFAVVANTSFESKDKPFALGYSMSPNLLFTTKKTYHNTMYGTGDNTLKIVNGYLCKTNLGLYLSLVKNLDKPTGYSGLGLEKIIKNGDILYFLFTEFGTSLPKLKPVWKIGFHVNIQIPVFTKTKQYP